MTVTGYARLMSGGRYSIDSESDFRPKPSQAKLSRLLTYSTTHHLRTPACVRSFPIALAPSTSEARRPVSALSSQPHAAVVATLVAVLAGNPPCRSSLLHACVIFSAIIMSQWFRINLLSSEMHM